LLSKIMGDCLERSLLRIAAGGGGVSSCSDVRLAGGVVMMRFLGTTPFSLTVLTLLTSLCQQLKRAYNQRKELVIPSDFGEL